MAITRPTGEQLRFLSQNTGEHVLDTYLESAEKGSRSLPDLLDDLFDGSGVFRAANFEFRFDATTDKIQFRAGNFSNGSTGWTDITTFFNITGAFNSSTNYNNFDVLTLTNKDVYIVHGLSSAVTFSDEAAVIASSNTDKLVDVSEARDWAKKTDGIVDSTDYSSKAWAIGGTGVTDTASKGAAKEWATKTGGTVDGSDYSAKHWATTGTVATVSSGISNINTVAAAISNVNTTATNISNVNTVGGISANVTTVAGISANVTTVAANNANVTTVATNNSNINSLATNMTDINTVADEIDNNKLQTVANNINAVITAADDLNESTSEIDTVATNIANVNTVGGISSNVTTVAGISANVTTVAGISANTTTVAGIAANVTTVAGIAADVTTAATNVTAFNNTYLGGLSSDPTQDPDGSALDAGDLYFDTTNSVMKVYDGSQWGNASSSISGIRDMFVYTATAGQTAFSGTDINSKSMTIDKALLVSVFMNGIKLVEGSSRDYTVDVSGNTITLTSSAAVNDQIEVEVFGNFAAQSPTDVNIGGGTIASTTINSATVSSGNLSFDDNQKAIFGDDNDLTVDHTGVSGRILNGTGNLLIRSTEADSDVRIQGDDQNGSYAEYFQANGGTGAAELFFAESGSSSVKLKTTSTGVDITGVLSSDGLAVNSGADNVVAKFESSDAGAFIVLEDSGSTNDGNRIGVEGDVMSFATADSERMFISSAGNVGIGTSSPSSALDVAGEITLKGTSSSFASAAQPRLYRSGSSAGSYPFNDFGHLIIQPRGDGANRDIVFATGTAGANKTVISSSGNVGIGTSSPIGNLQISDTFPTLILDETNTDAAYQQTQFGIDNGSFRIQTRTSTNAFVSNDYVIDKDASGATDHIWRIANSEAMRITSDGHVGIGDGSTDSLMARTSQGYLSTRVKNFNITSGGGAYAFTGVNIYQDTSGQYKYIDAAASSSIHYWGDAMQFHLAPSGTADATMAANEKMRLTGDGRLGLGTQSPEALLDVAYNLPDDTNGIIRPLKLRTTDLANQTNLLAGDGVGILFEIPDQSSGSIGASIDAVKESGTDDDTLTSLVFKTSANNETLRQVMRLKSGGRVSVGLNDSDTTFGTFQVNQQTNNDESGIAIVDSTDGRSMRLWCDTTTSYINSGNGGASTLYLNQGDGGVKMGVHSNFEMKTDPSSTNAVVYIRSGESYNSGASTDLGTGTVMMQIEGDSDTLQVRNINTGDYAIVNSQQKNGIAFYDGTGGLGFYYGNSEKAEVTNAGFQTVSDERLKDNQGEMDIDAISVFNNLDLFKYHPKATPDDDNVDTDTLMYGFSAQQLHALAPVSVGAGVDDLSTDPKKPWYSVNDTSIKAMMIQAIKALSAENASLVARLEALEAQVTTP